MGARNGVTAALLMQSGWTGVSDVFFWHENFFQSYAPQSKPEGLIDQLGERYEVTQTIIKKWSTGGPIQSPLDALVMHQRRCRVSNYGTWRFMTFRFGRTWIRLLGRCSTMASTCSGG
jgi:2-methylcitrate dehydratase PrpD